MTDSKNDTSDILIVYAPGLPVTTKEEMKDGFDKIFNTIAADIRAHKVDVDPRLLWIAQCAAATIPTSELEGFAKDIAPKGFVIQPNKKIQIQPE